MAIAELKQELEKTSPEDRLFLSAYLQHLIRQDDPAYQADLGRRIAEMKSGQAYSQAQLDRLLDNLEAEGL